MDTKVLKQQAAILGFDACGIARSQVLEPEREQLAEWLKQGMHGSMEWMARNAEMRTDPGLLMEGTRSVIVVLLNYYPAAVQEQPDAPVYSKYAYGQDYHRVMKKKLAKLEAFIKELSPGTQTRAFVDSAPLMERSWAVRAGLGWQGKNSLLITRDGGSFYFIGCILTSLQLEPDKPFSGEFCGSCTRCIESCPTGAIVSAGVVDARKCLSYQTIEYEGPLQGPLHNRVFGCDICQDVCPWNKLALAHMTPEFTPDSRILKWSRVDWNQLTEEEYHEVFKGTPADRAGYIQLKRNINQVQNEL